MVALIRDMETVEYVVNPMWFYWLQLVDNLGIALILLAIILFMTAFIGFIIIAVVNEVDEEPPKWTKWSYKFFIIGVALVIINIFIPTKKTLIEMEIARHATTSNVEQIFSYIDEKADKIIDALSSDKEE